MPSWIKDHRAWNKAKKLAKKQGKGKNYAYVTSIYKNIIDEERLTVGDIFGSIKDIISENEDASIS